MPDYAPRYEVHREIGAGATANVYLAYDVRHDRKVALKVLRAELTHAVGVERFLREIKLAAGLQHPNILAVFDSGETSDGVYYVMPYIEGETLRERLERGPIPVDEAVRIVTLVADALAYAHARGIVHRDVKPENIFLADGHAYVGDFGIAIAVASAAALSTERLTGAGLVVGTPTYMSPEQASGDPEIDGRSDEYSLACVFYEMLTRRPPFGPGSRANLADRYVTPAPQLRQARPDLPRALDAAITRALSVEAADRFPTVGEFSAAITAAVAPPPMRVGTFARRPWPARVAVGLATAAVIAAAIYARQATRDAVPLDPKAYAVFPFIHGDSIPELHSDDCQVLLARAIDDRWRDITVVDEIRLKSAYAQYAAASPTLDNLIAAARALGAGFVAFGTVHVIGDQVSFNASLYDVANGRPVRSKEVTLARAAVGGPEMFSKFALLADSLIVNTEGVSTPVGPEETRSVEATNAFFWGHRALSRWEVDSAASFFARAVAADSTFASANYWLAQTRQWADGPDATITWGPVIERAVRFGDRLPPAERQMAVALAALASRQFQVACDSLRSIIRRDSRNYAALFALADCIHRDPTVLRDPRSPTGWRFRASEGEAIRSLASALTYAPESYRAFRGRAFARLDAASYTGMRGARFGRVVSGVDTLPFAAFPALDGDTLVFWPGPLRDWQTGTGNTRPASHLAAVTRNREAIRRVTQEWSTAFPNSADALAAHATSLERLGDLTATGTGDAGALDLVARARRTKPDAELATDLAFAEFRLLLKARRYADAARVGDSLLTSVPPTANVISRLSGIAAVLGRVQLAASLMPRLAEGHVIQVGAGLSEKPPVRVSREALRLSVFAAAEYVDTSAVYFSRLEREVVAAIPPARVEAYKRALFAEPAALLFAARPPAARIIPDPSYASWLVRLQRSFAANDLPRMRMQLDTVLRAKTESGVFNIGPRQAYHAARLLLQAGDTTRALGLLDASLSTMFGEMEPFMLDFPRIFAVPQSLALRSELAAAVGDQATARRHAQALLTLWARSDERLQSQIAPLRRLLPSPP
jgi:tRNA A-37 threonylcarbamoyl transferase component Bud32